MAYPFWDVVCLSLGRTQVLKDQVPHSYLLWNRDAWKKKFIQTKEELLRKVREKERERDGLRTTYLIVQCSPLWFTSINIIGGWSSVLLYKVQQAYTFNICYGQLLN